MKRLITTYIISVLLVSGCSSSKDASPKFHQPHYLDTEIKDLTQELIAEQRMLARVASAKLEATESAEQRKARISRSKEIPIGFDKRVPLDITNDIETTLRAIAAVVGWGAERVYVLGNPPATPIIVKVSLEKYEPIYNAIEQIDAQIGGIVDIRIDPNFETIVLKYNANTGS
ncbi:DotD/TraH family lipoprotein [Photobacterium leiognathi]|uniref:DotD/TraH family lipoprotein n=1 Tax=Photobacterium leiognathi TaxID=553611 RepID=UPI0029812760|nr:DotD/TraH family lipoprotein [Photobacterium leiognathi]